MTITDLQERFAEVRSKSPGKLTIDDVEDGLVLAKRFRDKMTERKFAAMIAARKKQRRV